VEHGKSPQGKLARGPSGTNERKKPRRTHPTQNEWSSWPSSSNHKVACTEKIIQSRSCLVRALIRVTWGKGEEKTVFSAWVNASLNGGRGWSRVLTSEIGNQLRAVKTPFVLIREAGNHEAGVSNEHTAGSASKANDISRLKPGGRWGKGQPPRTAQNRKVYLSSGQ